MSCAGNSKSKRMQQNRFFDDPANFEKECLDQGADTQKNQISGMSEFLEKQSVDDSAKFEKESLEQWADFQQMRSWKNYLSMILPILKKQLDHGADTQKTQISGMNAFWEKQSVNDSANFQKESLE